MSVFKPAKENKKVAHDFQIKQLNQSLEWCREVLKQAGF